MRYAFQQGKALTPLPRSSPLVPHRCSQRGLARPKSTLDDHEACISSTIEISNGHLTNARHFADIASTSVAKTESPVSSLQQVSPEHIPALAGGVAAAALGAYAIKKIFDTPSRTYDENVGDEYDAWTEEGILEYYWGEHIHLGYYTKEERDAGYKKRDFIEAKYTFIDKMLEWSGAVSPERVIDVGCGIGGTSRYLAKRFPDARVTGITLSQNQVARGTELASERGIKNVEFKVMNALQMEYPDDTFDLVWACESGEHMPDKKAYVEEMTRVLKPGGTLVIATWCQRDETPEAPLTEDDKSRLQFLYDEWAHPYFISKEKYGSFCRETRKLDKVTISDWTTPTIDSWRHSIWVGVWDPWIVIFKGPRAWYKVMREIVTLERMHRAFADGLMEYGMIKATKVEEVADTAVVLDDKSR
jgi:MPBQ/MSBQ methyltransferase